MVEKYFFNLDNLSGYDFEDLVARIMRKIGYENIKVTSRSNDVGKDIIMKYAKEGENYPVVVQCKHVKFVGRPVVQKLQGAMLHEKGDEPFIMGIIVTSGNFSLKAKEYVKEINMKNGSFMKIKLIDGRELKNLCDKHNILILNGKIQIITNESVKFIDKDKIKKEVLKEYHTIVGYKDDLINLNTKLVFYPCFYMKYDLNSKLFTSIGLINTIEKYNQKIFLDGVNGNRIRWDIKNHFFKEEFPKIKKIKRSKDKKIIPFEFSEKDIEEFAFNTIIKENTEGISYYGRNNVKYYKIHKPHPRDIDIKEVKELYIPKIINNINIKKQNYYQEFFSNDENIMYEKNELKHCKICNRISTLFDKNIYLCKKCGKILCNYHKRLDPIDNTPVCMNCTKKYKLILQTKYFISESNKKEYINKIKQMGFLRRFYEDKLLFKASIFLIFLIIFFLIKLF